MPVPDELVALSFFSGIEPERLEPLARAIQTRSHPAGTAIFKLGAPADNLYFVLEGRVAIQIPIPGRGPATVMTVSEGELFGWSAVVAPHEEMATARAVTRLRALEIEASALRAACAADPVLGYRVASRINEVLASRLWAMKLQLTDIYSPGPREAV